MVPDLNHLLFIFFYLLPADQPKAPKAPTTPAPAPGGGGGGNKKVNMTQDSVKKPVIIRILKKEFSPHVQLRKSRHKLDYSILDIK